MARTDLEQLVFSMSADLRSLEKQMAKGVRTVDGGARTMERRAKVANDNIGKAFAGQGVRNALDGIVGRAPSVASGFDRIGVAGVAASAVLGGLTVAFGRAREAMSFGDELQTAADRLQTTAESLQALEFAAYETDVPVDKLRTSLEKLNGSIGAVKTGIGAKRVQPAFEALGITKESLAGVKNGIDLLPVLADRLGQVRDTTAQVQLARKLGIEELLPLLRRGSAGLAEMRDRAHELGLVISNETVQALADADRQMEIAGQQIEANLRAAFAGVAVDIAKATAALAAWLVELRKLASDVPKAFKVLDQLAKGAAFPLLAPRSAGKIKELFSPEAPSASLADIRNTFAVPAGSAAGGFEPTVAAAGGGADKAKQEAEQRRRRERDIADQIYRAELALLDAHNDSRRSVEDRLGFSLDRLDLERKQRAAELDQLQAQYAATKGIEGISAAERTRLQSLEAEARAAQERTLKEEAASDLRGRALDYEGSLLGYLMDRLSIEASLATTQAERRKILLRQLELDRTLERQKLAETLANDRNLTDDQRSKSLGEFDATTDARRAGVIGSTRGPLAAFVAEHGDAAANIERMEAAGVKAFENLADGLASATANAEDLGEVASNVFRQLIAEMLAQSIKQAGAQLIPSVLKFLPGFATGTRSAPGGLAIVGERGPEIVNLPRGSQVIPNHQIDAAALRPSGASVTVLQPIMVDNRHAVMTQDLLRDFQAMADRSRTAAVAEATAIANKAAPSRLAQYRALGT